MPSLVTILLTIRMFSYTVEHKINSIRILDSILFYLIPVMMLNVYVQNIKLFFVVINVLIYFVSFETHYIK